MAFLFFFLHFYERRLRWTKQIFIEWTGIYCMYSETINIASLDARSRAICSIPLVIDGSALRFRVRQRKSSSKTVGTTSWLMKIWLVLQIGALICTMCEYF